MRSCKTQLGLVTALFGIVVLLFLPALLISSGAAAPAPALLARQASTRAIAFESINQTAEPFAPTRALDFSSNGDRRTRVMLFATNLTLLSGDGPSAVTADGEDAAHVHAGVVLGLVLAVFHRAPSVLAW
jgi:hypothetical protein